MNLNYIEIFSTLTLVVSILVMCVSLITQVIKGVGVFKKVPTDLLVVILSIIMTVAAFWAYMEYMKYAIVWYMIVAAVLLGFLVAFVAMFGWEKTATLWLRSKYNKDLFEKPWEEEEGVVDAEELPDTDQAK